jgi:hypothetical protein
MWHNMAESIRIEPLDSPPLNDGRIRNVAAEETRR